jgi:hypothetical protein
MHAYIHTLSLLLCYRGGCSHPFYLASVTATVIFLFMFLDAFPLLPWWYYPLGVCILLTLSRAYEFLFVLHIALLPVGVAL